MFNPALFPPMPFMPGMPTFMPGQKIARKPLRPPPETPQATLYIRNLNEKVKISTLKQGLETVFSSFGKVLDIKVKRNLKHRGQAFVSFENKDVATSAMTRSQGFPLFDKPMDIQYALEPAYAVSALQGTDKLENHKRKRAEKLATQEDLSTAPVAKRPKHKVVKEDLLMPPNSILFVQNLPEGTTDATLSAMFSQFPGFKEIRLVAGRSDIAFVEYDTELESAVAKQSLHGYRMMANEMKVTFAKK